MKQKPQAKKQLLQARGRPRTEFANQDEVSGADEAALPSATGREESRAADEPLRDFEAEVKTHERGGRPRSEMTGGREGGTPGEDEDGLDEVARALRDAAEAPPGRNKEL
ncbi:MAG TPA: hypothetical protein VFA53_06010 [Xanthobacteraceae bacterium]|nr:hypothetical protein [Xanthobacteraceae bacterium]